jgi:hypothetical protein
MKAIGLILLATMSLMAADEKAQVLGAMESFKQAMLHRDRAALDRLLSPDLLYTHSAGGLETKAQFMEAIVSGKSVTTKLEFGPQTVRIYGKTALVKMRVDLWHSDTNIVNMDVLHVWVNNGGNWQMVARQATRLAK